MCRFLFSTVWFVYKIIYCIYYFLSDLTIKNVHYRFDTYCKRSSILSDVLTRKYGVTRLPVWNLCRGKVSLTVRLLWRDCLKEWIKTPESEIKPTSWMLSSIVPESLTFILWDFYLGKTRLNPKTNIYIYIYDYINSFILFKYDYIYVVHHQVVTKRKIWRK